VGLLKKTPAPDAPDPKHLTIDEIMAETELERDAREYAEQMRAAQAEADAKREADRKATAEKAETELIAKLEARAAVRNAARAAKMDALLAQDDDQVPPPSWLVEGVIAARSLTLLIGKQGHGKSTVAESIVQAVATGSDWLGRFKTRQAKVLVVQLEMIRAMDESLRDRIAAGAAIDLAEVKRGAARTYADAARR